MPTDDRPTAYTYFLFGSEEAEAKDAHQPLDRLGASHEAAVLSGVYVPHELVHLNERRRNDRFKELMEIRWVLSWKVLSP